MKLALEGLDGLKVVDQKGRIALGSKYAGKRFVVREEKDGTATLIPIVLLPEREHPLTPGLLTETFTALELMQDNWDGHGSQAPSTPLIMEAREALALLHAGAMARGLHWEAPHVGVNERGHITLEWWSGERSLTVFVRSEDQVNYLKSWGKDIVTEMEDGELHRLSEFASLSRWLYDSDR
jgi:hypothetical protein